MTGPGVVVQLFVILILPPILVGIINRTRSLWSGRRGPKVLQTFFDLARLVRKRPVYSDVSTELFRLAPLVALASVVVSALLVPLLWPVALLSFPYDFVALAYLWALGRIFLILGALDVGSPFEGMGASREAAWGALLEPALFLTLGTLAISSGHTSLAELFHFEQSAPMLWAVRASCAGCLLIVLQVEASRVPVDDPATHLELTMIHEVMVLDHSGPELAALQYGSALKLTICAAMIAALLNPVGPDQGRVAGLAARLGLMVAVVIGVGFIESLIARLKLKSVPKYLALASASALFALMIGIWERGGAR